jgi:murein L,D-transpeptidase YcbB/YkuD
LIKEQNMNFSQTHSSRTAMAVKLVIAAGIACSGLSPTAAMAAGKSPVAAAVQNDIDDFYQARAGRPLWLANGNFSGGEALLDLFDHASIDRVDSSLIRVRDVRRAMSRAVNGDPQAVYRADRLLTENFVRYVRAMRTMDPVSAGWEINDRELTPTPPSAAAILREVSTTASPALFVRQLGWMSPLYAQLRQSLASTSQGAEAQIIRANMERARILPGSSVGRYVLVNIASQQLEMWENGKVAGSMKVVVGKPEMPTPQMAALIRYTAVNPYWNLPSDLVAERVAPNVLKEGQSYLTKKGYVILSDWSDNATVVSPTEIDWDAVAAGTVQLRMRQKPGVANAMGKMKFMFPNPKGVYLHDTPQKELMADDTRLFSAGCVRLEAAPKLAAWLYGRTLKTRGAKPEQRVDLDKPVPVYLAYLTAKPKGGQVSFYTDIYHRDPQAMADASMGGRRGLGR